MEKLERFVVTGSYIPTNETAYTAGMSPVVRIDQKVIDDSGLMTTSEVLQRITVSNGGAVPISNNASGASPAATSISLRGLGPEATLVLINGRRVANYPVGHGGTTAFVDLNSIPLAVVDHIEVLKDGASAIYGADAVAGVVNIKMKRGFDGSQLMVTYGNTTEKDSSELSAALIAGAHTEKASAFIGFNYYRRNAILNQDRSYSAMPPFLSSNSSPYNLEVSRLAANAALGQPAGAPISGVSATQPYGANAAPGPRNVFFAQSGATAANQGAVPAGGYVYSDGRSSTFNFNEFSMSYPRRDNRGVFAYADHTVRGVDHIRAYLDAGYQQAETENQLAPSATNDFSTVGSAQLVIPARTSSPILTVIDRGTHEMRQVAAGSAIPANTEPGPGTRFTDGAVQRLATAGASNPFNPFNQDIAGGTRARLADFGNRLFHHRTEATRLTLGLKGENIAGEWNFDAGYSHSSIRDTTRRALVSASRFNRLLNAADPFFQTASRDSLGTTQPYNPFGYFRNPLPNNTAIAGAALLETTDRNHSRLDLLNTVISTGSLFNMPDGAVGFAFGADFRQEELEQHPDPASRTGDIIGSAPVDFTEGQRKVWGVFAEWSLPLLTARPGAHDLTMTVAARHENVITNHASATVPKVGLRWQPFGDSVTLRASGSKGFRQPSLHELYSTQTASLYPIQHPLTGLNEPEQAVTVAGNRRLVAEKTKYLNMGIVWSPQLGPRSGLSLGVDYWEAYRRGTVTNNYQDTVNRFFGRNPAGGAAVGGLLPGEGVQLNPDGSINSVNSVFVNLGRTSVAGFDYSLSHFHLTDTLGRFEFSTVWSMYTHYRIATEPGGDFNQVVNQPTPEGSGSDNGYLRWKGRVQVGWAHKGFATLLGASYTDGFWDRDALGRDFFISPRWIHDVQFSYNFKGSHSAWLAGSRLAIGARNLFDRDPPFASGFAGNSTGYPGYLYTSEGRLLYVSLTRKF